MSQSMAQPHERHLLMPVSKNSSCVNPMYCCLYFLSNKAHILSLSYIWYHPNICIRHEGSRQATGYMLYCTLESRAVFVKEVQWELKCVGVDDPSQSAVDKCLTQTYSESCSDSPSTLHSTTEGKQQCGNSELSKQKNTSLTFRSSLPPTLPTGSRNEQQQRRFSRPTCYTSNASLPNGSLSTGMKDNTHGVAYTAVVLGAAYTIYIQYAEGDISYIEEMAREPAEHRVLQYQQTLVSAPNINQQLSA